MKKSKVVSMEKLMRMIICTIFLLELRLELA
jgi:hypothetical protein